MPTHRAPTGIRKFTSPAASILGKTGRLSSPGPKSLTTAQGQLPSHAARVWSMHFPPWPMQILRPSGLPHTHSKQACPCFFTTLFPGTTLCNSSAYRRARPQWTLRKGLLNELPRVPPFQRWGHRGAHLFQCKLFYLKEKKGLWSSDSVCPASKTAPSADSLSSVTYSKNTHIPFCILLVNRDMTGFDWPVAWWPKVGRPLKHSRALA